MTAPKKLDGRLALWKARPFHQLKRVLLFPYYFDRLQKLEYSRACTLVHRRQRDEALRQLGGEFRKGVWTEISK